MCRCLTIYDIDHDPTLHTIDSARYTTSNNNNNTRNDEEETQNSKNNRLVSSLTANNNSSNGKITSLSSQTHLSQTLTQISTEPAALINESSCGIDHKNLSQKTINSNNNTSTFNCDTTKTDNKRFFDNKEFDSIFVQTESWKTAKSYTEAIKHRKDSTDLLGE